MACRRIDSPNDFVRIEIEAALKRGIPVVPVYVDDAKVLREADLPDGLKDLVWYNGYNLSTDGSKFAASIASLIAKLEPHFIGAMRPAQPEPRAVKPVAAPTIIRPVPEPRKPVSDNKADAKKYFESGKKRCDKGERDHAIADYDQAIRLDPKNDLYYASRGWSYLLKKDYNRAIADFDQAIRLDLKCYYAYVGRAGTYYNKGEYDRAIADCDQAVLLDQEAASALGIRGSAYGNKGDYDRAIADFERALAINPNYQLAAENKRILEELRAGQNREEGLIWLRQAQRGRRCRFVCPVLGKLAFRRGEYACFIT